MPDESGSPRGRYTAGDYRRENRVRRVRYLNDGSTPAGPIVEGSGLTALRARVEAAGGAMEIAHAPRFELTLTFFEGRQEIP